jgi:hypothetical protein
VVLFPLEEEIFALRPVTISFGPNMAGFGFSIGDILAVSTLALRLYNDCKKAGGEFEEVAHQGRLQFKKFAPIPWKRKRARSDLFFHQQIL